MNNVSHRKIWCTGALQTHFELHPVPLIEINNDTKVGKYCVKLNYVGILHQKIRFIRVKNGLV